jgi:hypothetical protein
MLLGTTCALLNHCYIFRMFLICLSKNIKNIKNFFNTIMLRWIFKNIQKILLKKFPIVFLMSKLFFKYFHAYFK